MKRNSRVSRLCFAVVAAIAPLAGAIGVTTGGATSGAATPAPTVQACTFNGSSSPFLLFSSPGEAVNISCTGMGTLHPYLVFETSLLLAIDPAAKPLLTGQVVSVAGLLSLLSSLPEVNTQALTFPTSDLSGNLTEKYTLPTSHAPDPNAVCPPTKAQINSGLIGCALTMIDLTTFKPVAVGNVLVQYSGDPFLPPGPTLASSSVSGRDGKTVSVSDKAGAKTFWWPATLASLAGLLGGGTAPTPTIKVTFQRVNGFQSLNAANNITISPAVYNPPVLTPPKISGGFTVPLHAPVGQYQVTVSYVVSVLGNELGATATDLFKVVG